MLVPFVSAGRAGRPGALTCRACAVRRFVKTSPGDRARKRGPDFREK
jgi:hypothetical protein